MSTANLIPGDYRDFKRVSDYFANLLQRFWTTIPTFFLNTSGLSPIDVQIYLKKSIVGPLSRRVHTVYIKIYLHVDKF